MSHPPADPTVTIVVRRRTRPGCEADFEQAMREFIAFALASPGNLGIHVIRSEQAHPREYTVVDRFADADSRRAFTAREAYREWMLRLRELTVADPLIEEMHGLSGWFALPDQPTAPHPPEWKMALITFVGVYPLTSLLPPLFASRLSAWHPLVQNLLVTGIIVALLTWVVMPALTRLFRRWLFHPI